MRSVFVPLEAALARCRRQGLSVPFWWRDDDAVTDTPELQRLMDLADLVDVPVFLAVIPEPAKSELAGAIRDRLVYPVVHGWAHRDNSAPGQKKSEFGLCRDTAAIEIRDGMKALRSLFGRSLLPFFVPPWNRVHETVYPLLTDAGFTAISTFGPRKERQIADGLTVVNTHIDPINWRGSRDLVEPEELVKLTVQNLTDRLETGTDADEPLGLLTHHLVHSEAVWNFAQDWLRVMQDGGAVPWKKDPKGDWP